MAVGVKNLGLEDKVSKYVFYSEFVYLHCTAGAQLGLSRDGCEMLKIGEGAISDSFNKYLIYLVRGLA